MAHKLEVGLLTARIRESPQKGDESVMDHQMDTCNGSISGAAIRLPITPTPTPLTKWIFFPSRFVSSQSL